jgi:LuxR family maltose regulon positive regulatory protein
MSNLLTTKLHRPSTLSKRVQRPHLNQRLDEGIGVGRQFTLVSAPAGFGKTTCISQWAETLEMWPVAWLSLDNSDDDPGRFFAYFVAALQGIDETIGKDLQGLLNTGQSLPLEAVSTTLINDIRASQKHFLLVLDDFQVIQDFSILQFMETVVVNLPLTFHLVLITREDPPLPLARLRANNRMTEIRAGDLRFTGPEVELFLNDLMGLCLSPADVAVLEDRTEGWIVGLQLAGLSIRERANPSSFIASLSGSHRYILGYLTEEVLSRQSPEIQDFLLQTSTLERLNGDLCNAVTGRTDASALLEQLFTANLFLVPLDDDQHWYRYHHLFADLLRDRQKSLQKEKTIEIHRLASRWFAQAGMPTEAIQHALSAADDDLALGLIESHAVEMLVQGYAKTVEAWLTAIPVDVRFQSPKANLALAWMHLLHGNYASLAPFVERLQTIFGGDPMKVVEPALQAEWSALQAYLLAAQRQPAESLALANQALELVPQADGYVRSLAYNAMGTAYIQQDDYSRAVEVYQQAILYGRASANFVSERLASAILIQIALQHGQYRLADQVAREAVQRIERAGSQTPIDAAFYGGLGQIHYQWLQFEKTHRYFQRAIQLSALVGYSDAEIGYAVILSRLHLAQGELAEAAREIHKAIDRVAADAPAWTREEVVFQEVRLYLAQNQPATAQRVLEKLISELGLPSLEQLANPGLAAGHETPLSLDEKMSYSVRLLYNSALRIILYQAGSLEDQGGLRQAIDLAEGLISGALHGQYLTIAIETLLLRCKLYAALGDARASQLDLIRAVELAEPEGFITIFIEEGQEVAAGLTSLLQPNQPGMIQLEYIQKILAAFPKPVLPVTTAGVQTDQSRSSGNRLTVDNTSSVIQPLSPRELEILGLIGAGCSNQEIAERLVLSLHTVKKHSSNIFAKLGVNSRTQAVARARQLQLL